MRRAELRLETYLAENRGGGVTMKDIKRECRLDWDEARHVWRTALPRLASSGLVEQRPFGTRACAEFRPTPHLVAGVAHLQWRCVPGAAELAEVATG
jgi:hypothetical protein